MKTSSALSPTLLSIAGSDPSGGAGIQADLKTMTSLGVYGAAAVTCLTVQNSKGVQEINTLPPAFIRKQIEAVLVDHNVTHIKIGMTGTVEILTMLGKILQPFNGVVVYDPVLASTCGEPLLQTQGLVSLKEQLLNQVTISTPNKGELELLSNTAIDSFEEAVSSAKYLMDTYPSLQAVVVKGGHFQENSTTIQDYLVQRDGIISESKRKRRKNTNLHGTGCTYSSALASYLCLGQELVSAFQLTGRYMDNVIQAGAQDNIVKSGSNGPLSHHRYYNEI